VVLWTTTEAGNRMALDPTPDPDGNVIMVPADGGRRARVLSGSAIAEHRGRRWRPHAASCPYAYAFRSRRRANR